MPPTERPACATRRPLLQHAATPRAGRRASEAADGRRSRTTSSSWSRARRAGGASTRPRHQAGTRSPRLSPPMFPPSCATGREAWSARSAHRGRRLCVSSVRAVLCQSSSGSALRRCMPALAGLGQFSCGTRFVYIFPRYRITCSARVPQRVARRCAARIKMHHLKMYHTRARWLQPRNLYIFECALLKVVVHFIAAVQR